MRRHNDTAFVEIMSKSRNQYVLLGVIVFIASILRFHKLGEWSFWIDEMITVNAAQDVAGFDYATQPIYLALINLALSYLGINEWSARLVPALVGVLTIIVLYFPIRKIFGPVVAVFACLLLALSPWHLYWSQNARFYSLLFLLYSLALFFFYFGIEEDRPGYLLLSLCILGLATRERMIALFLVPVAGIYLLLLKILPFEKPPGFRARNLGLLVIPSAILGLVFALPYLREPSIWLDVFSRINNNPFWIASGVVYYIGLPVICVGTAGAIYLLRKMDRAVLLLSIGAVVPLFTIMVVSLFHYTANRYVFVSLTSWVVLASVAAKELFVQTQRGVRLLVVGVLFLLILSSLSEDMLYYQFQNGNRDDWRSAFEFVSDHREVSDLVVSADPELGAYYLGEETIGVEDLELSQLLEHGGRVWFVEDMNVEQRFPDVHNWIVEKTQLIANMDVHVRARNFMMRVYLYDPGAP